MGIQANFFKFHENIKLGYESESYSSAKVKDLSITKAVKEAFKAKGYSVIDNFIQGSFSTHTAVQSLDGDFDIDRAIVIDFEDAPENPVDTKKVVLGVLEKRGFTNATIKKPCVTADYAAEDLHIDFPIYSKQGDSYFLAVGKLNSDENNREWSSSDPKGLKDWVNDKSMFYGSAGDELQQFKRIVRYLKRWRDVKFSEAVAKKVYSIGLTVMAKESFLPCLDDDGNPNDLKAMKDTVNQMTSRGYFSYEKDEKYRVRVLLPTSPWRDIFDGSALDTGTQFINKLNNLDNKLLDALTETDEIKQCKILNNLFGEDFIIPELIKTQKAKFSSAGTVGTSQGA